MQIKIDHTLYDRVCPWLDAIAEASAQAPRDRIYGFNYTVILFPACLGLSTSSWSAQRACTTHRVYDRTVGTRAHLQLGLQSGLLYEHANTNRIIVNQYATDGAYDWNANSNTLDGTDGVSALYVAVPEHEEFEHVRTFLRAAPAPLFKYGPHCTLARVLGVGAAR